MPGIERYEHVMEYKVPSKDKTLLRVYVQGKSGTKIYLYEKGS